MQPTEPNDSQDPKPPNPISIVVPFGASLWFGFVVLRELGQPNPHPLTVTGGLIATIGFLFVAGLNLMRTK